MGVNKRPEDCMGWKQRCEIIEQMEKKYGINPDILGLRGCKLRSYIPKIKEIWPQLTYFERLLLDGCYVDNNIGLEVNGTGDQLETCEIKVKNRILFRAEMMAKGVVTLDDYDSYARANQGNMSRIDIALMNKELTVKKYIEHKK